MEGRRRFESHVGWSSVQAAPSLNVLADTSPPSPVDILRIARRFFVGRCGLTVNDGKQDACLKCLWEQKFAASGTWSKPQYRSWKPAKGSRPSNIASVSFTAAWNYIEGSALSQDIRGRRRLVVSKLDRLRLSWWWIYACSTQRLI
jgi:hypothetical protein